MLAIILNTRKRNWKEKKSAISNKKIGTIYEKKISFTPLNSVFLKFLCSNFEVLTDLL